MARNSLAIEGDGAQVTWRDLEQKLDELQQLCCAPLTPSEFFSRLLSVAAASVAARAAILWQPRGDGSQSTEAAGQTWEPVASWFASADDHQSIGARCARDEAAAIQQRLRNCALQRLPQVPVRLRTGSEWYSGVAPIQFDGEVSGLLEVSWSEAVPAASHGNIANILSAFAEVAGEYERHRAMQDLRKELRQVDALDGFAVSLQRLTDERSLCFTIANELGQFVQCDRMTVLTRRSHWRVRAISHVDGWDRRSPLAVAAERLASVVALDGEPVWLPGSAIGDDSPASDCWQSYLDESGSRAAALIPLVDKRDGQTSDPGAGVFGALLIERFSGSPFLQPEQALVQRYARQSAAALARAAEGKRSGLRTWLARRSTIATTCLVAVLALTTQIPVDLEVSAEGHVHPVAQRNIFASSDGQVRLLHVQEGAVVEAGDVLLELSDVKLDFELTELTGEIRTARQQLATLQAARLDAAVPQRDQRWQLAAEEERLKQVVRGLEQQEQHLRRRRDELIVRSPIAGRVITTNVEQLLRSRPVRRGQQLLTIADEQGAWVLELRVTDRDAGYVLAAQDAGAAKSLRFVLATQPTQSQFATIEQVSRWTEIDETGVPSVRVTATIDNPAQLAARPGGTATAKIDCGRGRLGYVWFRDLIELLRARFVW